MDTNAHVVINGIANVATWENQRIDTWITTRMSQMKNLLISEQERPVN